MARGIEELLKLITPRERLQAIADRAWGRYCLGAGRPDDPERPGELEWGQMVVAALAALDRMGEARDRRDDAPVDGRPPSGNTGIAGR